MAEAWGGRRAKRESSDESGDERRNDPSNGNNKKSDDKEEEEEDDADDVAMKTKYGDSPMAGVSLQSGGLHGEVTSDARNDDARNALSELPLKSTEYFEVTLGPWVDEWLRTTSTAHPTLRRVLRGVLPGDGAGLGNSASLWRWLSTFSLSTSAVARISGSASRSLSPPPTLGR